MPFEVVMPRLGWTMETGALVEWLKADGERVEAGEILFTVEGDKAVQEVEALEGGTLRIPADSPQPGEEVPVGTVLGYILQPGEAVPARREPDAAPLPEATEVPPAAGAVAATRKSGELPAISPRARRVAAELGVDWTELAGSGRTGRIVERDVRAAAQTAEREVRVAASPVARRLAAQAEVDLVALAARAPGKKLMREDVEAAIAAREAAAPGPTAGERRPITQLRRVIAQRMVASDQATAAVTLTTEADATELVALRERLKAALAPRERLVPTYTDLLVKLTAAALEQHPLLNASWEEDEIVVPAQVHIAVAVDTEGGLLTPVVRDVPDKSILQIAAELRGLAEGARARTLAPEELSGGTFTLTNLGPYGIDAFTPIINLPQCAILGVGRIIRKPAIWGDAVVPRHMLALSLTFDHRIVDGGPAARFLQTVREYVEEPYLWLAE
jgi:pyruvate dehydrogenase E2 component (dihydrolipoamide acetyltransferase)